MNKIKPFAELDVEDEPETKTEAVDDSEQKLDELVSANQPADMDDGLANELQKFVEEPAAEPAVDTSGIDFSKAMEQELSGGAPAEEAIEEPVEEAPVEQPEIPVEQPIEQPAEQPMAAMDAIPAPEMPPMPAEYVQQPAEYAQPVDYAQQPAEYAQPAPEYAQPTEYSQQPMDYAQPPMPPMPEMPQQDAEPEQPAYVQGGDDDSYVINKKETVLKPMENPAGGFGLPPVASLSDAVDMANAAQGGMPQQVDYGVQMQQQMGMPDPYAGQPMPAGDNVLPPPPPPPMPDVSAFKLPEM